MKKLKEFNIFLEKKPGPNGYMTGLSDKDEEEKEDQMKKQGAMDDDDPNAYKEMPGDKKARKEGKVKKSKFTTAYHKKFKKNEMKNLKELEAFVSDIEATKEQARTERIKNTKLSSKLKTIDEFTTESIDFAFDIFEGVMSDLHIIAGEAKDEDSFVKTFFKDYGDKIKKSKDSEEWVRSLYKDTVKESFEKANKLADDMFGEFGVANLSSKEMKEIIDMKKADKIAKKKYGEFGFATLAEEEMEEVLDNNPELVKEAFIGPFVFNDRMSDDELKAMYNGALDGYANYSKGFQHPKSKYKQAYQEIEKILKKRGVSVDEAVELVHVYKDGELYGTGELVKGKDKKIKGKKHQLIRFDGSTEDYYPAEDVKLVEAVSEASISHAEIRKLEKHLSSNNKRALAKAIKDGTIKTSEDLSNWVKSIEEAVSEAKIARKKGKTYQTGKDWTVYMSSGQASFDISVNNSAGWSTDPHDDRGETFRLLDAGKERATVTFKEGNIDNVAKKMHDLTDKTTYGEKNGLSSKDYADILRVWIDMGMEMHESVNEDYDKMLDRRYGRSRDYTDIEVKDMHFQTDADELEKMKLAYGYRLGGMTSREKIEDAEYELRRYRKTIKYGNGKEVGVFLPGSYDAATSTLGDGPHKSTRPKVKWNQRKYDQWIEDVASNDGWKHAADMAQNANNEPGLIDWVKRNNRGDDPLQRIQWDIEAMAESVNKESLMERKGKITGNYGKKFLSRNIPGIGGEPMRPGYELSKQEKIMIKLQQNFDEVLRQDKDYLSGSTQVEWEDLPRLEKWAASSKIEDQYRLGRHQFPPDNPEKTVLHGAALSESEDTISIAYYNPTWKQNNSIKTAHVQSRPLSHWDDKDTFMESNENYMEKLQTLESFITEKKKQTNDQSPLSDDGMETGIKNKAKESGVPVGLLRIIMKRGLAAWKSGHRPGATQAQWGYARVNSFLTKQDGTWGGADSDIAKKVRDGGHDKKL